MVWGWGGDTNLVPNLVKLIGTLLWVLNKTFNLYLRNTLFLKVHFFERMYTMCSDLGI